MPIIKSAKKALAVSRKKTVVNNLRRAKIKEALKGARIAVDKNDKNADKKISSAYRELDMAAKSKLIHKNKAARLKSRLAKRVHVETKSK